MFLVQCEELRINHLTPLLVVTMPYTCWFLWRANYLEDFKWGLHFQIGVAFWRVVLREVYFEGPYHVWRALKTSILNIGFYTLYKCSSLKCAHAFQCEALQNNHTSLNFQTFLQHFTKETLCWPFCIEYEKNTMSHHIEEVHAIKWWTKFIWITHRMHLIVVQL